MTLLAMGRLFVPPFEQLEASIGAVTDSTLNLVSEASSPSCAMKGRLF